MAKIELGPGEEFTHSHPVDSTSQIETGKVLISFKGKSEVLTKGMILRIPSKTIHTMVNMGEHSAIIKCSHGPNHDVPTPPPPPPF